ncbi:hypothetical protein [Rickettsiella endosymbiont of Miltochrista miniata]|uniref:hypothetical protein n=1 Tax=Rickettsiella endosymbiont of Miltochrista miniata TaxID=3066239 RepID=UPI00313BCBFD
MLLSRLDNQKGTRKILVDLLFKKGYCLCIPDPEIIKSHLEQVRPSWIQNFFLSKNELELSVIPMFMLIFVKNKSLTTDQSKRLLELLHVLMSRAEFDTIDQILFDNKMNQMAWAYYILSELIKFTLNDFASSDKNSKRMMALAASIEFFFDKASALTMTKLSLNSENTGFHIIHKLMYVIAYETLHPSQVIYLSAISKKIIDKTTNFALETLVFQTQPNGFSFIWCVLGTWLRIVFAGENSNQFKINQYSQLLDSLLEKINDEKLSSILLENETKGYIIILRYIFFKRFRFSSSPQNLSETFSFFNRRCKKIFSALTLQQIELILDNLPLLLMNDRNLSYVDRQQLMQDFFVYLFEFSRLQPQEIIQLKDLKQRLEDRSSPSNKIIRFLRQIKTHCRFFNRPNFRNAVQKEDEISLDESSDLLSAEYARLNTNYLTVSM